MTLRKQVPPLWAILALTSIAAAPASAFAASNAAAAASTGVVFYWIAAGLLVLLGVAGQAAMFKGGFGWSIAAWTLFLSSLMALGCAVAAWFAWKNELFQISAIAMLGIVLTIPVVFLGAKKLRSAAPPNSSRKLAGALGVACMLLAAGTCTFATTKLHRMRREAAKSAVDAAAEKTDQENARIWKATDLDQAEDPQLADSSPTYLPRLERSPFDH